MAEGGNIAEHINEFMDTVESLTEVEITLADEILVILLLSRLPRSFENFVVAIEETIFRYLIRWKLNYWKEQDKRKLKTQLAPVV